jgi:hypothetical protein
LTLLAAIFIVKEYPGLRADGSVFLQKERLGTQTLGVMLLPPTLFLEDGFGRKKPRLQHNDNTYEN